MLDPEYILRLSEGAEQISSDLHTEIINRVIERIMIRLDRGDNYLLTAADKWQLEVLQESGYLREAIQKEIAKKTKLQLKEIKAAFEDAGIRSIKYDDEVYNAAGISTTSLLQSPYLLRLLQRGYEATAGEWYNYTRTTADAAQRLFIERCDKAYNLVTSGALSYQQATADAVQQIAKDGVVVTYPSGHTDTIETATLRAVRTGVSQSCAQITEARMDEYGWDIILTSAHLGARYGDGGEDFTNHYWWQGKFYSRSGKDTRFPPFSVCGEGDVQGIFGANCRHSIGPGDGINNPYKDSDSEENRKRYDLEQQQRTMERRIRALKRERIGLKTALDNAQDPETKLKIEEEYRKKSLLLEKNNIKYNQFCEGNRLKRQAERLQIAQWDRSQAKAAIKAADAEKNSVTVSDTGLKVFDITDDSIKAVPKIEIPGWSDKMSTQLQQAHKDLLAEMKKYPAGTEGAAVYDASMNKIGEMAVGESEDHSVSLSIPQRAEILIHNHPDGQTFSHVDLQKFIYSSSIKVLTAVSNTGAVRALLKKDDYDGFAAYKIAEEMMAEIEQYIAKGNVEEYTVLIEKTLKEMGKVGIFAV